MRPADLLRRAAGKSPGYLARRGLEEIRKRAFAKRFRHQLKSLAPGDVAREAGAGSLRELWRQQTPNAFRLSADDRLRLRELYRGAYAAQVGKLRARVERILRHEFDLLGSGPTQLGPEIDWLLDFKSGRRWELTPSEKIDYAELDRDSDVKIPWEISRGQHLTALGRAWVIHEDARCPPEFEAEVRSWIRSNPIGLGVNWSCTMDVGLRAVSWIWTLGLMDDAPLSADFFEEILFSLYQHGLWIPEYLEEGDINGNHLISDVLGLVACGTVFRETSRGKSWLELGAALLEREIRAQVGEDGVDFEASIPYHRLVLEIFLVGSRLLEFAGRPVSAEYRSRLEAMFGFVHAYVTPEGLTPIVGDADDGRALVLGETEIRDHRYLLSTGAALFGRSEWKSRAGKFWEDSLWLLGSGARQVYEDLPETAAEEASRGFDQSGFYVLRSPAHYLFADFGPVGFRGRGVHGHNDCLSFEWHARGRPLLTDSGTYVYTASPLWRNRFRSTSFHNTIRVDEEEINRISPHSLFTLKNDAQPIDVGFTPGAAQDLLHGAHTGYRRLADPVTVSRSIAFDRNGPSVRLEDHLEGRNQHLVEFFFHAAPGARPEARSASAVAFLWPDGTKVQIERDSGPEVSWESRSGWFSPSYGVRIERPVWTASVRIRLPFRIVWVLSVET